MVEKGLSAILLIACKDQKGIVARVASFIHDFGGNILDSDHHTDRQTGDFLMRTEFELDGFQIAREEIAAAFNPVAKIFGMNFPAPLYQSATTRGPTGFPARPLSRRSASTSAKG